MLDEVQHPEPSSVYLDPQEADDWFWEYQEDEDEWWFYASDYEPVYSVKVMRWDGSPLSLARRPTTMPKGVREVVKRSGLTLFEKNDAGISHVALDKAVVMKAADDLLATMEWMKTNAD